MSRHTFTGRAGDLQFVATLGYDRPLKGFHLVIQQTFDDPVIRSLNEDVYVYSNLDDEALADVWGYPRTLDYYISVFERLAISLPPTLLGEVRADRDGDVGNRIVTYDAAGTPTERLPAQRPAAR